MCEEHSSPPKYDIDPTTSATRSSSTYFPSPCMELRQSTIDSPNTLRKQLLKEPSEHGIGENELVEMEKGEMLNGHNRHTEAGARCKR